LARGQWSWLEPAANLAAKETKVDWIVVAILTLVGLALRLAYLLRVPPFLDEYSSMLTGMGILRTGGIPELPSGVLYPSGSLFSYLEAAFIGLFGFSDLVARLPSLLLAGATLPVLYVVASKLLNRQAALLSVALLALAPEAVVWGGRARMYTLLQLLVLVAIYFFYRGVLDPRAGRAIPSWMWSLFFLAAIFSQDEAIMLLPIFWVAALVVRGPRWFLRPGVLLGQVVLPLAGVGARYWLNEIRVPGEVYTLTHDSFFRFPPALAHGLKKIAPFFTAPAAWPPTLCFVVALILLVQQASQDKRQAPSSRESGLRILDFGPRSGPPLYLAYVVLALAVAIVLVVNTPWQDDRYLFMVLPLFLMVAAWGVDQVMALMGYARPRNRGDRCRTAGWPGGAAALRAGL
jgi:4-amino-4-deoxy-L-arabinose transferase-like glycosyltransferase